SAPLLEIVILRIVPVQPFVSTMAVSLPVGIVTVTESRLTAVVHFQAWFASETDPVTTAALVPELGEVGEDGAVGAGAGAGAATGAGAGAGAAGEGRFA